MLFLLNIEFCLHCTRERKREREENQKLIISWITEQICIFIAFIMNKRNFYGIISIHLKSGSFICSCHNFVLFRNELMRMLEFNWYTEFVWVNCNFPKQCFVSLLLTNVRPTPFFISSRSIFFDLISYHLIICIKQLNFVHFLCISAGNQFFFLLLLNK